MKKRMIYRMGKAKYNEETREYDPRPVNKVILVEDGVNNYVQMEKQVAPSLEAFRDLWPNEPVEGAPTTDELSLTLKDLSDEELAGLGLARTSDHPEDEEVDGNPEAETDDPVAEFATEEARLLAGAKDVSVEDLLPEGGTGEEGTYTTDDIRTLAG